MSGYRTIVADPPWPFVWRGEAGGKRHNATQLGYDVMSIDQIAALPIGDLAADDAHLYLWVTCQLNRNGIGVRIARAWGFEVVSEIIWEKPSFGMGAFPRLSHEPLLVCKRGSLSFTGPRNVRSVQRWKQTYAQRGGKWHSAKPEGAYTLIEAASPAPRVELFARQTRIGWGVWPTHTLEASA